MKGNRKSNRITKRRRRNANGSTVARNQTKYHRQYVGFETTFTLDANTGAAMPIAPGNYNSPGSLPTTAYSQNFAERFSYTFKAWRMLGWKGTMFVTCKADANSDYAGLVYAVAFNQSVGPGAGPTPLLALIKPNSASQLCEMPNVQMISTNPANSKNRASFSYFQGRRDINSLPFQDFSSGLPYHYVTGIQIFYEGQPTDDTVFVRLSGNLLVEFKDPAFFMPPALKPVEPTQEDEHVPTSRLRRVDLV